MDTSLNTIESKVYLILMTCEESRDDDYRLISEYLKRYTELSETPIWEALESGKMPCIEGITRTRRKLQEDFPELKGSRESRRNRTEAYKEYAEL